MGLILLWITCVFAADSVPDRFIEVSPGIFRSAQPEGDAYYTLKNIGVKTLVNLSDDPFGQESDQAAAEEYGFAYIEVPLSGFWAPTDQDVDSVLEALHVPANYPVLLHCQHGRDRTGLLVGLYRVLFQGWTPHAAYQEMLDRGFRPYLIGLDNYFRARTGYSEIEVRKKFDRAPAIIEMPQPAFGEF